MHNKNSRLSVQAFDGKYHLGWMQRSLGTCAYMRVFVCVSVCTRICQCVCVYVSVCVCVSERMTERERECVCVCV